MDSNPDGTEVYVEELPKCNFCDKPAHYDGKTTMGPWAYMCEEHFKMYGIGLGTGKGQKLIPRKALREAEKLRGEPEKELSATMTEDDLGVAAYEEVWYPKCPYCGAKTPAEPDAHAVYCEACNRRFKIINPFFSTVDSLKLASTNPGEVRKMDETLAEERTYPRSAIPEPYQTIARAELRKIPTWKLQEAYDKLGAGESTGIEIVEENRAYAISAIREILWERGKLKGSQGGGSMEIEARIAEEAAVGAATLVGSQIAKEIAKQQQEEMHGSPITEKGKARLGEPPLCYDFRGTRSWIMVRSWQRMEKEHLPTLPGGESWSEVRRICAMSPEMVEAKKPELCSLSHMEQIPACARYLAKEKVGVG